MIDDIIQMLKSEYRVEFPEGTEEEAKAFLKHNNYWGKLVRYTHSFSEHESGPLRGKPKNLTFEQLRDLSSIDMHFRKAVLSLSLDLEHALQSHLLNHISNNSFFDDKKLITALETELNTNFDEVMKKVRNFNYNYSIAKAYEKEPSRKFANIIEILSFGELVAALKIYDDQYPGFIRPAQHGRLFNAMALRNAAAHNNALLVDLNPKHRMVVSEHNTVQNLFNLQMSKETKKRLSKHQLAIDFASLLRSAKKYCSPALVNARKKELTHLLTVRCMERMTIYMPHEHILIFFDDLSKIVDIYLR